jgi:hypothetical protein
MEIKATLNKPYSETERLNFIVEQNHQLGYEIKETETALEAWGYTEEEKEEQEQERIGNLQCTKRVFILMLEQLGLDYFEQIEPAIKANRQAKLEWELCVELQRKNPLLDQLALQFGITSKQLDDLFKFANGEITQEEFLNK